MPEFGERLMWYGITLIAIGLAALLTPQISPAQRAIGWIFTVFGLGVIFYLESGTIFSLLHSCYAVAGSPYPRLSLVLVSLLGATVFGGGWWWLSKLKAIPQIPPNKQTQDTTEIIATVSRPINESSHAHPGGCTTSGMPTPITNVFSTTDSIRTLSNIQLKNAAIKLAMDMQKFQLRIIKQIAMLAPIEINATPTQDMQSTYASDQVVNDSILRSRAVNMRDELISRLASIPDTDLIPNQQDAMSAFEGKLTGYQPISDGADYLVKLAKQLPAPPPKK